MTTTTTIIAILNDAEYDTDNDDDDVDDVDDDDDDDDDDDNDDDDDDDHDADDDDANDTVTYADDVTGYVSDDQILDNMRTNDNKDDTPDY